MAELGQHSSVGLLAVPGLEPAYFGRRFCKLKAGTAEGKAFLPAGSGVTASFVFRFAQKVIHRGGFWVRNGDDNAVLRLAGPPDRLKTKQGRAEACTSSSKSSCLVWTRVRVRGIFCRHTPAKSQSGRTAERSRRRCPGKKTFAPDSGWAGGKAKKRRSSPNTKQSKSGSSTGRGGQ